MMKSVDGLAPKKKPVGEPRRLQTELADLQQSKAPWRWPCPNSVWGPAKNHYDS